MDQEVHSEDHVIEYGVCIRCSNYFYTTWPNDARDNTNGRVYRDAGLTRDADTLSATTTNGGRSGFVGVDVETKFKIKI